MIRLELIFGLLVFVLWLFCLLEVIRSDEEDISHLPKLVWLLIVLFFPLVGSVLWLLTGRPAGTPPTPRFERAMPEYPEYDRPGRAAATSPEADEAFLRKLRERAEEQRRVYREQLSRREYQERGDTDSAM